MNRHEPPVIVAEDLSYSVEAQTLLDGVRLHAEQGQFVGVIGPNGAGKSTLLRALSGMLRHQRGAVRSWRERTSCPCRPGTLQQGWRSCPR